MGYTSDNTRTRWGRRRPYIFFGAITVGIVFAFLWQLPPGRSETFYIWYFLADTIAYVIAPYFLLIMQNEILFNPDASTLGFHVNNVPQDMIQGAADLAILIGIVVVILGVMPALFLRERHKAIAVAEAHAKDAEIESAGTVMMRNMQEFFVGFGKALKFRPFLKLCAATFLVFNGFIMIAAFQSYVIIYYVFGGDTNAGSEFVGYAGSLGAISSFVVIFLVTWLCPRFGKRRAFYVTTGLSMNCKRMNGAAQRRQRP